MVDINKKIAEAMKAGDTHAKNAYRALKTELTNMAAVKNAKPIDDTAFVNAVNRLIKTRQKSLEFYAERPDLAEIETAEIAILETLLPEQLTEDEIKSEIEAIINQLGASSMKDMGRVMGTATKALAGKADNRLISSIVRNLLT